MIDLNEKDLKIVKDILKRVAPECEVRAFGSRVKGKAKRYSDLDLALIGREKLDWRLLEQLRDEFSISDLPIMVDVADWQTLPDFMKRAIEQESEIIQAPQE